MSIKKVLITSSKVQRAYDVIAGRIKRPSGVVRSKNHKVPPVLKEGTFSAMFLICISINLQIEFQISQLLSKQRSSEKYLKRLGRMRYIYSKIIAQRNGNFEQNSSSHCNNRSNSTSAQTQLISRWHKFFMTVSDEYKD